ncbi:hypothetical protein [Streptomyces sp. NPDC047525]|uniref:hypothetical protein n=1 Tax=Streptomyces sp. NPDC047525 TaxID=3155264 RepID=UPI0033DFD02B
MGESVVERSRGGRAGVSHARRPGAGGDGFVDRGQGAGDVQEPVGLGAADAELRCAVRLPGAVAERQPHPGRVCGSDPGGQDGDGAPDVVHRAAQPCRHLPGPGRGEQCARRFDDVLLVLAVRAHDALLRDGCRHQGVREHGSPGAVVDL